MTTAKMPMDKKSKKALVETSEGFCVSAAGRDWVLSREALDDFELLSDLAELDKGNEKAIVRIPAMLKALLGDEQYRAAMALLRDGSTGRVSVADGVGFVTELFGAFPNS